MTTINLIPDDSGLQRLRIDNEAPTSTTGVSATAALPRVEKHPHEYEKVTAVTRERRHADRRHGERRAQNGPVLLDTRSYRERRNNTGQRKEDKETSANKPHRINLVT